LFFYSSFIYFVVKIDNYFDKIKYIAKKKFIAHNFVFEIVFKIAFKHCYKCNIVLFDKINIFLKFSCVVYCKDLLN